MSVLGPSNRNAPVSRRSLLRGAAGAAGLGALATIPAHARSSRYAVPNLNFNRQAGQVDVLYLYVPFMDEVLPMFEEETGITVNHLGTYVDNPEWWARLQTGEQVDFLIATTDWVQRGMAAGNMQPIDLDKISNLETLQPDWQRNEVYVKDGESYAVPFTRVYYSMTYNTEAFPEAPTSWGVTWDEAWAGQISIRDHALTRIVTTALYLGQDPWNPSDWDAIRDALVEQKPLIRKYWEDYQNGMEIFLNEEALVGQLTAGRTRMAMEQGGSVNWTVPEEGCLTLVDNFVIPETAQNVDEAHQLIDFLIRPDILALEMELMRYDTLSAEATDELPEDLAATFAVPEGANLALQIDLAPEIRAKMDELWTEVKLS